MEHAFPPGKQDYLFKISLIPGNFQVNAGKTCVLLTSQPVFPELHDKWIQASTPSADPFSKGKTPTDKVSISFTCHILFLNFNISDLHFLFSIESLWNSHNFTSVSTFYLDAYLHELIYPVFIARQ